MEALRCVYPRTRVSAEAAAAEVLSMHPLHRLHTPTPTEQQPKRKSHDSIIWVSVSVAILKGEERKKRYYSTARLGTARQTSQAHADRSIQPWPSHPQFSVAAVLDPDAMNSSGSKSMRFSHPPTTRGRGVRWVAVRRGGDKKKAKRI